MHDASPHEHIDRLLAALETPLDSSEQEADPLIATEDGQEHSNQEEPKAQPPRPWRIVNIYLDLLDDEEMDATELHTVDSTLDCCDEITTLPETDTPLVVRDDEGTLPRREQQRHWGHRWLPLMGLRFVLVTLLMLVGTGFAIWSIGPLVAPVATITIVPVSTSISTQATFPVVTRGVTDAAAPQIVGRLLSSVSLSQQASIPTTGTTTQEATVARGTITFYNAAPLPQTVLAGTLITSPMGEAVVTDSTVSILAAQYPLFGQATVAAHAVLAGPNGNLPTGAIYGPCCRVNLSAVSGAFHGGQAARTYQSVSQQDPETVLTHLKASLAERMEAAVRVQVQAGETLLHPLECQAHSQANHPVGAEATQLSMTMSETCTGVVYQNAAFHALVERLFSQEATRRLGKGYQQVGDVTVTTTTITPKAGGVMVVGVTMSGTWAYQFGPTERAHLLRAVAGKSKAMALTMLMQLPGVVRAWLGIERGSSVPSDPAQIHLMVLLLI